MPKAIKVGSREYYALIKKLRTADGGKLVLRQLTKEFRKAGRPVLQSVRAGAKAIPSKGYNAKRGRPTLRRALVRAATLQVKARDDAVMIIKINGKKMPDGQKGLPPYVEGAPGARLRHPVFGRDQWVSQTPHPFFQKSITPKLPAMTQAVNDAIESIRNELER